MSRARQSQAGFTLIEVMVALVIVAVGLSAVVVTTARSIDSSQRFRERALALYIGMNVITELRLSDDIPEVGDSQDDVEFANLEWTYNLIVSETPVEELFRLEVEVAMRDTPDVVIRTATGFVGLQPGSNSSAGGSSSGGATRIPRGVANTVYTRSGGITQ